MSDSQGVTPPEVVEAKEVDRIESPGGSASEPCGTCGGKGWVVTGSIATGLPGVHGAVNERTWTKPCPDCGSPPECPTCGSSRPDEHPAIGVFGIPDTCKDPFHGPDPLSGGSPSTGTDERRWTVYLCDSCGRATTHPGWNGPGNPYCTACQHGGAEIRAVPVVPEHLLAQARGQVLAEVLAALRTKDDTSSKTRSRYGQAADWLESRFKGSQGSDPTPEQIEKAARLIDNATGWLWDECLGLAEAVLRSALSGGAGDEG